MTRKILLFVLFFTLIFGLPSLHIAHADISDILQNGIVPCGNEGTIGDAEACQFADLIKLMNNILDIMFYIAILIFVGLLMKLGFDYLTAGSNTGQLSKAKEQFKTLGIGFLLMVSAYLIINLIVTVLINPEVIKNPLAG